VVHGIGITNAGWGNELTVLHIPMAVQYLGVPVGAALMAVFTTWDLLLTLRGYRREERYEVV
jgi:TRAP-type C4-dicarboxylate transport system permease small subunit